MGTFYANASVGFVVDNLDGTYSFTYDSRKASTWPTFKEADKAAKAAVMDFTKEKRYWSVLRPAIGHYATC